MIKIKRAAALAVNLNRTRAIDQGHDQDGQESPEQELFYFVLDIVLRCLILVNVAPLIWDQETKTVSSGSTRWRWRWLRWKLTMGTVLTISVLFIFDGRQMFNKTLNQDYSDKIFIIWKFLCSFFSAIFVCLGLTNMLHMKTFPMVMNTVLRLHEIVHHKFGLPAQDEKFRRDYKFCTILIVLSQTWLMGTPFLPIGMYLYRCEYGLFSLMLPICQDSAHVSWFMVPVWIVLSFVIVIVMCETCVTCIVVFVPVIIFLNRVISELGSTDDEEAATVPRLRSHKNFVTFYRYLLMYSTILNEAIYSLLPGVFLIVGVMTATTMFFLVRFSLTLFFRGICIGYLIIMMTNLFAISMIGADMSTNLTDLKTKPHQGHGIQTLYIRMRYRSCAPIRLYVGDFTVFSRFTPLGVFYRVLDLLVTLFCSIPK